MKNKSSTPTHEEIAMLSRQLWEEAGCPDGRSEEFWLRAEQQLKTAGIPAASPPALPTPIPQSPAHALPPAIREVVQPVARPQPPGPAKRRRAR